MRKSRFKEEQAAADKVIRFLQQAGFAIKGALNPVYHEPVGIVQADLLFIRTDTAEPKQLRTHEVQKHILIEGPERAKPVQDELQLVGDSQKDVVRVRPEKHRRDHRHRRVH